MNKTLLILTTLLINYYSIAQFDTTNCEHTITDTLEYVINKSNTPTLVSMNNINDGGNYGYSGYAQLFEATDSVTINGFCFYGLMFTGVNDSANFKLYNTDNLGNIDSLMDSIWVDIPLNLNYAGGAYEDEIKICIDFNTPKKLIGDYVIALQNNTSSDMYIGRNMDGLTENLSFTYYSGVSDPQYNGWYRAFSSFGAAWDFDIIIEPIVSYSISTQHLTSQNSNCFGDTLSVSSSISYNDSLLFNRMYNPNYNTYSRDENFVYQYGDTITTDTSHVYSTPGAFNALFSAGTNMSGWTYNNYIATCGYYATAWGFEIDLGADTTICADSINLTGGQFFDAYLWNTTDTTDIITVYADSLNNGVYQYSVRTDIQGCYSYDTINISVGELPVNLGSDTSLCLNQQLNLSTNVEGDHNWSTGQLTDTITVGPFNNPSDLIYTVEVESAGCIGTDTINITIDNCVGVDEQEINYSIYPNPVKTILTIDSENLINSTISLTDMQGKLKHKSIISSDKYILNVNQYDNGVYILNINNEVRNIKQFVQIIK